MKPLMLALDMDDTLLRSDLSISDRTRNAIKRTEETGVTVVLASGRIPEAMEYFSRLLGLHKRSGYIVSNNGALIQESHTGNVIHEARLESRIALAICDLADSEGFPVQMYKDDTMYISRSNEFSDSDQRATGIRQVVVENFRGMLGEGCHKLIIPGDPAILTNMESLLRTCLGKEITMFTSRPYFLEIMPRETNKGSALAKIADILGINAEDALAIGDSMNDEAMIRWAGIGVAMANGDERIKNIADFVTDNTNDDDGVAEIIEKYLFGKGNPNE
jgi:Cof subfamily protein (haloacid dehalogenase superfamily)